MSEITKNERNLLIKGLKKYIEEVTTNPMFETQIFKNIGDGVGVTKIKTI